MTSSARVEFLIDRGEDLARSGEPRRPRPPAAAPRSCARCAPPGVFRRGPARETRWMAEIGAFALRSDTELLLKSRRVVPGRLLREGFKFEHPTWEGAAQDLCARWRQARD